MKQFATVGIGPGLDVEDQDEVTKKNLVRAAAVGNQLLNENFKSGWSTTTVNGWRYPSPQEGRAGDDFLLRAAWQSLLGIVDNDPEEAVYIGGYADGDGEPLTGANSYEVHFAPGQEPPVDAFWSMTMYANYNLVPNPIDRYSLGDRSKGLKRDSDGGVDHLHSARLPRRGEGVELAARAGGHVQPLFAHVSAAPGGSRR
jgi:hypothetical protein